MHGNIFLPCFGAETLQLTLSGFTPSSTLKLFHRKIVMHPTMGALWILTPFWQKKPSGKIGLKDVDCCIRVYVFCFQIESLLSQFANNMAHMETNLGQERARQAAVSFYTYIVYWKPMSQWLVCIIVTFYILKNIKVRQAMVSFCNTYILYWKQG